MSLGQKEVPGQSKLSMGLVMEHIFPKVVSKHVKDKQGLLEWLVWIYEGQVIVTNLTTFCDKVTSAVDKKWVVDAVCLEQRLQHCVAWSPYH